MKKKIGVLLFALVTMFTIQAQPDDFAQDGSAISLSQKGQQIFRLINHVRVENDMSALIYQSDDQPLANLRAEKLTEDFSASMESSNAEVAYQGSYAEIARWVMQIEEPRNYHFDPAATNISVALAEKRGTVYAVVRLF